MNREQAEKLLAALVFDDLDDASKAELLAYLQTDDELRERLADMRMAAKLACDAVNDGPDPVLSSRRLKALERLAKTGRPRARVVLRRYLAAAAAVLVLCILLAGRQVGTFTAHSEHAKATAARSQEMERRLNQDRYAASSPEQRPGGMGGMGGMGGYGGGRAGSGMGGMGGYGMGAESIGNSPTTMPQDGSIRFTGGASTDVKLDELRVAQEGASSRASVRARPLPSSSERQLRERLLDLQSELNRSETMVQNGQIVTGGRPLPALTRPVTSTTNRPVASDAVTPSTDALAGWAEGGTTGDSVPYGWSDTVTSTRSGGTVFDIKPAGGIQDAETSGTVTTGQGDSDIDYSFRLQTDGREPFLLGDSFQMARETVSNKVPALGKDKASSLENADRPANGIAAVAQEATASAKPEMGQDVSGPTEENRRVPVLGDLPTVSPLFREESGHQKQSQIQAATDARPSATDELSTAKVSQLTEADPNHATVVLYKALQEDASELPSESRFKVVPVNPWVMTERDAQSTFALDVDTASYALCRRYIRSGFLPPIGAVRMEEFINSFDYAYPQRGMPTFSVYAEGAPSPFAPAGQDLTLLKIAVKARTVGRDQRRAAHLVFVIDASASMGQVDRLGVVQSALDLLTDRLSEGDRVSLVTCANEARLHLEAVSAQQKDTIRRTIDAIQPAGSTNLLAGLKLGYATARRAFVAGQINQVVLCSDGVANVGQVEADAVLDEVAEDRKQGITLTCVGVGYGAYNDAFLEALADHGDGRYVFLDSAPEAQEAFVGQLTDTLQTVAKDARIQVQFDPARVRRYRLIGYENRDIEDQRFRDDTIDAGEVGSGQCSTALYELELTAHNETRDAELGTVFVRYRDTETDKIEEISRPLAGSIVRRRSVEEDPRFFLAAGAARFAEWLRQSEHAQYTKLAEVQRLLDDVSAALPLDRDIQELAALAHQAENLPRAP